jgi:hypothetical protein
MRLNKLSFLILTLCLWSCAEKSVQLPAPPPLPVTEPLKTFTPLPPKKFDYSFEELHAVANYTTVVFSRRINDQIAHRKSPAIFKCDPSDDEINVWSMQLKSLIDEQTLYVEQNILTDKTYQERFANCEKTCICGEYASILQNFNPSQLNKTQLFQLSDMDRKHKAQTEEQMFMCAKQFKKFCGSPLHKQLKKIVQQ